MTSQTRSPQTQASSPMIRNISSVSYMIYYLQWEALESRRTKIQLTLFFKVIHNLIDISADRLYLIPSTTRTRSTHSKKYRHFFPSSDSFKFSYFPRTLPLWNSLPAVLAEAHFLYLSKRGYPPSYSKQVRQGPSCWLTYQGRELCCRERMGPGTCQEGSLVFIWWAKSYWGNFLLSTFFYRLYSYFIAHLLFALCSFHSSIQSYYNLYFLLLPI